MLGIVGIGVVGYGVWQVIKPSEVKVEIIKGDPSRSDLVGFEKNLQPTRSDLLIMVDVAGAVEKPGVYKLPSGSRIGDALVVAGGLAAKADREWVSQTINLAEVVKDGGKVYIPIKSDKSEEANQQTKATTRSAGKVNINTASEGELDGLSGIGAVRAKAIVDNRPYGATYELMTKAKIPQNVYEDIKDSLSVY